MPNGFKPIQPVITTALSSGSKSIVTTTVITQVKVETKESLTKLQGELQTRLDEVNKKLSQFPQEG